MNFVSGTFCRSLSRSRSPVSSPSRGRSASRSPRSRSASRSHSPVMSCFSNVTFWKKKNITYHIARNFHANLICTCWQVRSDWARESLRWWATITRERRDLRTCTTITMVWMILLLPLHPLIWEVSSYLVFNNYIILLKRPYYAYRSGVNWTFVYWVPGTQVSSTLR